MNLAPWLEVLVLIGAFLLGVLLTLLAILLYSLRQARRMRGGGPRGRIEVLRVARSKDDRKAADRRAQRVVEVWADQAASLESIDARLIDYNRRMVEEVAAAYGRRLTEVRISKAARRAATLLSEDLSRPLATLDRYLTVDHFLRAHRYFEEYKRLSAAHPYLSPGLKAANSVRKWAVRAHRVLNLAIPKLLFFEAATSAALHYGKRYVQEEMRDLTERVGIAAIELYGEALVGQGEMDLIEASLLFDVLVRMARIGGPTTEKDLLLKKYMGREVGDLERVEDLYSRFRESLGEVDVGQVADLVALEGDRERLFFAALEELAATHTEGTGDRRRADELRATIRERFDEARARRAARAEAEAEAEAQAAKSKADGGSEAAGGDPGPTEAQPFERIAATLIEDGIGGASLSDLARHLAEDPEAAAPAVSEFFDNEAHFFRALDVQRFAVGEDEARYLIPRLARLVSALRLVDPPGAVTVDRVGRALLAACEADRTADPGDVYVELRRGLEQTGTGSVWNRLTRMVTGDPRHHILPTDRILAAARKL